MVNPLLILLFGFLLGIKHSIEPDHVITVATIVRGEKNSFKASLLGLWWGFGHTVSLFVLGIVVLVTHIQISSWLGSIFELIVGVILIVLGIKVLFGKQLSSSVSFQKVSSNHKSLMVGLIHGIAGSGALMLLILSTISSLYIGILYIIVFGAGSIIGMTIMSLLISIPFLISNKKIPFIEKFVQYAIGVISILFGLFYSYNVLIAL